MVKAGDIARERKREKGRAKVVVVVVVYKIARSESPNKDTSAHHFVTVHTARGLPRGLPLATEGIV